MHFCEHSVIIACNDSNYQKVHFLIVLRVKKGKKVAPHGGITVRCVCILWGIFSQIEGHGAALSRRQGGTVTVNCPLP